MSSRSVAEYWDKFVGSHLNSPDHWEANQVVQQSQWRFITGSAFLNPIDWFMQRFGPFARMASICSGSGLLERHIAASYLRDPDGRIDGYDISPGSVEVARAKAAGMSGVYYHVCDINSAELDASSLDAAFAHGALHHIRNLDHCLGQIRSALQPTGYLYVNDYVGPRRYQWTDVQLRLARELLSTLPSRYVRNAILDRCDPVALKTADPSEAVRSDHIMDHVHAHFDVIVQLNRGGTLLAPIFGAGCISPSAFETEEGMQAISRLCARERALIDGGVIRSDHVVVVARPRPPVAEE
jgi:SAM-dependent methyltransferase